MGTAVDEGRGLGEEELGVDVDGCGRDVDLIGEERAAGRGVVEEGGQAAWVGAG